MRCTPSIAGRRLAATGLALALVLGACADDAIDTAAPATSPTAESTVAADTTAAADTTPTADTTAALDTAPAEALDAPIALTGTSAADVKLGDDADAAIGTFTQLFGAPATDSGWVPQQSPCEGMGTRSRTVSWGTFHAFFATGPTSDHPGADDHLQAFQVVSSALADSPDGPPVERFVLSDGKAVLGRTVAQLQAWDPSAERFDSEIEGPVWSAGTPPNQLSGSLGAENEGGEEHVVTARAGTFCID